jgi:hypothetical protein
VGRELYFAKLLIDGNIQIRRNRIIIEKCITLNAKTIKILSGEFNLFCFMLVPVCDGPLSVGFGPLGFGWHDGLMVVLNFLIRI